MQQLEFYDLHKRLGEIEQRVLRLEREKRPVLDTTKIPLVATASGDTTVVAAVTGYKIRVIAYDFLVSANVDVKFKSGSTDITGLYSVPVRGGKVDNENESGWFETAASEALKINLSAAVTLGGTLTYILVEV